MRNNRGRSPACPISKSRRKIVRWRHLRGSPKPSLHMGKKKTSLRNHNRNQTRRSQRSRRFLGFRRNRQTRVTNQDGTTAEQRQARPAGKSAHIPDPKFKANFGRPHTFTVNRVITTTTIVPNQTRFFLPDTRSFSLIPGRQNGC